MKTPEEIKKGLKLCLTHGACYICPYDDMTKDCDVCRPRLVADVEAYIQQLEAQVPRWISVEERLPKHGAIVFCNTKYFYEVLQWDDDAEQWIGQHSVNAKHYVTHWMPLPELPKEV